MQSNKASIHYSLLFSLIAAIILGGCAGSQNYLKEADEVSHQIIEEKQKEVLGRVEPFTIVPPSESLREKLLLDQNLPVSHLASFGSDNLKRIEKWPEITYPEKQDDASVQNPTWLGAEPITITMLDALQIASRNSREYQSHKRDCQRQDHH